MSYKGFGRIPWGTHSKKNNPSIKDPIVQLEEAREKSLGWKIVAEDKRKLEITTMVNSNHNWEAYCGLIGKVLNL